MYFSGAIPQLPTRGGDYAAQPAGPLASTGITSSGASIPLRGLPMPAVPPRVFGRLPIAAIEGREPDPFWDLRSDADGLSGNERDETDDTVSQLATNTKTAAALGFLAIVTLAIGGGSRRY